MCDDDKLSLFDIMFVIFAIVILVALVATAVGVAVIDEHFDAKYKHIEHSQQKEDDDVK